MDFINQFINQLRMTYFLLLDRRVPLWAKAIPVLGLLYVVWPFDLIPAWIPGLGQLDDLVIFLGAMRLFERAAPAEVVAEHRRALAR